MKKGSLIWRILSFEPGQPDDAIGFLEREGAAMNRRMPASPTPAEGEIRRKPLLLRHQKRPHEQWVKGGMSCGQAAHTR